ncbi:MAG: hypothetical protein DWQ34_26900 [Planctomycetota bacterium]|nr:MAG: hypothetical protein DWQ34_26900 [Planctomycetota bacterium]
MLSERFEWNADDHGLDRFSLIAFCGVQSIHAWINAHSSLPPFEGIPRTIRGDPPNPRKSVSCSRSPWARFRAAGPNRVVCNGQVRACVRQHRRCIARERPVRERRVVVQS